MENIICSSKYEDDFVKTNCSIDAYDSDFSEASSESESYELSWITSS